MKLKVTFITAVKNRANLLRETLQSLIAQDVSEWEAVIVDNRSDEPIEEVVKSFSDQRLRYFRIKDGEIGISGARNYAVSQAQSEILLVADADDINEPFRARITYEEMARRNYDVFYSPLMDFNPEQNKRNKHPFQPFDPDLFKMFNCVMNPSAAFRRQVFEKAGGYDPAFSLSEDYDLFLRMLNLGASFGYTEKILVNYRRSPDSVSLKRSSEMHDYVMKARIKNKIKPFDIEEIRKYALPEIAASILSESGKRFWRDDRFMAKADN